MASNGWIKVGTIVKNKDPKKNSYVKVDTSVSLTKGQYLTVINPRKRPGISEEDLAKIPDFVVADLLIAPAKE